MAPLRRTSYISRVFAFAVISANLAAIKGSISSVCPVIKGLGMQSKDIPDGAITESSVLQNSPQYKGYQARLHNSGAWITDKNDVSPWIQVKFSHRKAVTMISTQGYTGFIKEFFLSYSDDGLQWTRYNDSQGRDKVFQGNTDVRSIVNITINPPLEGLFIRLQAKVCDSSYCALRMELYGCNYTNPLGSSATCPPLIKPADSSVSCTASNTVGSTCTFVCGNGYKILGSPLLHCQPNSTWNGTLPACYAMPSEPRNIRASSTFSNTINIAWDKPAISSSSVIRYFVYWKAGNEPSSKEKTVQKLSASLDVKPFTVYAIKVRAQSAHFNSPWSTIFTHRSDEAAPSMAPSNFQVESNSPLTLTVTWSEIPEEGRNGLILGYKIHYYKNKTKSVPTEISVASNIFKYTIKNLEYDDYFVSVAAHTRIGYGPNTSFIRKVPMEGAPTAPQNLKVVNQTSNSVFLSWAHPVKTNGIIKYYTIKYGLKKDQLHNSIKVMGYLLHCLVQPLEEFSTHYFLVFAETAITGKPSQIVSAKTLEDAPDDVPSISSINAHDAYTISVSWNKLPTDKCNGIIRGYIVFYKPNGQNVQYENKTIDDESKLRTEITGLKPFTEVCVKMAAFTSVGVSTNWDNNKCKLITTHQTGPSAPRNVRVRATSSTSLLVEWDDPVTPNGIISSYHIFKGTRKDSLIEHGKATGKSHSKEITGLKKYTTYYIQVRGRTSECGNASEIAQGTTFEGAPSEPLELICNSLSDQGIHLAWKKPSQSNGIIRYYLITTSEKVTGQQVGKPINKTFHANTALMKIVSGLKPYREYVLHVRAVTVTPGKAAFCLARTEAGAPSEPTNVQVVLTGLSITIKWDPPVEENGILSLYKVYCIGQRSYDPRFENKTKVETKVDNREVTITNLYPGTEYEVYVIAKTTKKEGKKSKIVTVETPSEAPPAPEQPEVSQESVSHDSITLLLKPSPQKNGEVIAHQVIVEALGKKVKRSVDPLPSDIYEYKTAKQRGSRFYLAAEFRGIEVPQLFVLGDGKHYHSYYNAPLEPATRYRVYVRGVTKDQYGKWVYGRPAATTLPATAEMKAVDKGNEVGLIAGIIGAIILIAIIIIAVALYRRSKRPLKANVDVENCKSKSRRRFRDLELRRIGGKKRPLSAPGEVMDDPEHPAVPMENFSKHVHKLHKSDDRGFMIEYNKLDGGREFPCEAAYLADNKNKNRYGNIVAYDHSRVVLSVLDGKPCTDYINASHIDGYNKPSAYIATQGPVPHTFDDFWRMVWEQQSATIVMLTNLQERHKLKCHKYWPDKTEDYGDISVRLLKCEHYADYSIRTFNVKREIEKEEREVRQFHFIVWPDHGVPEYPTAILAFRRRVRAYNPPDAGPVIVHCSAGVGRSGTFIVIDAMLDRIKAEKTVDIFNYVAYLRSRRTAMVQTEEQYTFCHDAILESIQCGNTQILAHDLRIALSKMDHVDKDLKLTRFETEFKTLNKVSPVLPKACYIVASYPENKEKNRYHDILASDFSRVMLTAIDDNEITTYINAVHISGYKQQHAFIVTQYPLTATVTDFWRMLCEQESACLVVFQPTEEGDFPQFWPDEGKATYDDMITVECHAEKSNSVDNLKSTYDQSEITERKFKLKDLRTPEKEIIVKMFVLHGWANEDDPVDTSSMITLVAKVEKWQQQSGNGPITVMCSDGIGRSGTFCALYSVLERVKIEQVVDVLQAIKAMRIPRPGLVKTTAEYKSVYYSVQEYLAAFDDYANFK